MVRTAGLRHETAGLDDPEAEPRVERQRAVARTCPEQGGTGGSQPAKDLIHDCATDPSPVKGRLHRHVVQLDRGCKLRSLLPSCLSVSAGQLTGQG